MFRLSVLVACILYSTNSVFLNIHYLPPRTCTCLRFCIVWSFVDVPGTGEYDVPKVLVVSVYVANCLSVYRPIQKRYSGQNCILEVQYLLM